MEYTYKHHPCNIIKEEEIDPKTMGFVQKFLEKEIEREFNQLLFGKKGDKNGQ